VGDVCEVKSGPAFQNVAGSALVAVMRRSGELAQDFAERHGVPRWSASNPKEEDIKKLMQDTKKRRETWQYRRGGH